MTRLLRRATAAGAAAILITVGIGAAAPRGALSDPDIANGLLVTLWLGLLGLGVVFRRASSFKVRLGRRLHGRSDPRVKDR